MTDAVAAAQKELDAATAHRGNIAASLRHAEAKVAAALANLEDARRREAEKIPVDRTDVTLTDGTTAIPAYHREITASGQQKGYIVLSEAERAKGFVRPVRDAYRHVGVNCCNAPLGAEGQFGETFCGGPKGHTGDHGRTAGWRVFIKPQENHGCGSITTMGRALAETYARDPKFYSGTFCCHCRLHFPVGEDGEFTWYEMDGREGPRVGT